MVSKEDFNEFIYELVRVDEYNSNLKYISKQYETDTVAFLIIGFVLFFTIIGILPGIICLIVAIYRALKTKKVEESYMEKYNEIIVEYMFKEMDYTYETSGYIERWMFTESQFLPSMVNGAGVMGVNDKLVINIPNQDGSKSKCNLTVCDVFVNNNDFMYFGIHGYIEFPFEFVCNVSINTKYKMPEVLFEEVKLEDINFNKTFNIYSDDQVGVRRILTPDVMEKLLEFDKRAKKMQFVLKGKEMFFGFPQQNLFQLRNNNENIVDQYNKFYDDICLVFDLVKDIKENIDSFKM